MVKKRKKKIKIKSFKKKIKAINNSKKIIKVKSDESKLEESMEELRESFDKNKFAEFLQPSTKSISPVLEKVADASEQIIPLEQSVSNLISDNSKDNQPDYIANSDNSNYNAGREETENQGDNYQSNGIAIQPEKINIETAGRNLGPAVREAPTISPEFQRTENIEYVKPSGQLERINPNSSLEQRKTEAQELESRMKKYEIR